MADVWPTVAGKQLLHRKKKNLEEIDQDSTLYLPNSLECVCLLYFPEMSITHMPLLPIF